VTSTQIILKYRAPDENNCLLSALNLDDPTVVAYDLDRSKFPSADSDFRHIWNVGVLDRTVIVGKRTSDTASDGKLYSRALEADARYRIGITCGGETVSIETETDWIPAGDLFPENPPFNPDGLGNYAWPTIDWSDRTHPYIDPRTGVKIKFGSFPGDWSNKAAGKFGAEFWLDLATQSHWINPQNASSGNSSTLARYSGVGKEALFVGVDPSLTTSNRLYGGWGGGEPPWSVDDFGVHVIGAGTDPSPDNRTVSICLSIDSGQSCYTKTFDVVLPANTAGDTGVRPANFPSPMFAGWGKAVLRSQMPTTGTVDINENILTLLEPINGSTVFNVKLAPGSKIRVAGSAPICDHNLCTIVAVRDASHLELKEHLKLSGVSATLANFGVRVVKTTSSGEVALSLSYENAWSFPVTMPSTGNTEMCSHIPVQVKVDAIGAPLPNGISLTGYNCAVNGQWYWISTDTGESRLISLTNIPGPSEFVGWDSRDIPPAGQPIRGVAAFDAGNANVAYVYASLDGGGYSLFKLTYGGDYRALNYKYPAGNGGELPSSVSDSVHWTNLSPASQGKDLTSQLRTRFPSYDIRRFGEVTDFRGISGDYAMFMNTLGGQDTPCWIFQFNMRTQVLDNVFNTWDGTFDPILRWQACHSGGSGSITNTSTIANKPIYTKNVGSKYGGPFVTPVTSVLRQDGQYDSKTVLTANADGSFESTCPAGLDPPYAALSGTQQCTVVHVAGEPCSGFASTAEAAESPCPWDRTKSMLQTMAVGDYVADATANIIDEERLVIVRKTVLSMTNIELVLLRLPGPYCGSLEFQRQHADGWSIEMAASGMLTCESGFLVQDIPNNKIYAESRFLLGGHFDYGAGATPGTYGFVGIGFIGPYVVYNIRENMALSDVGNAANGYAAYDPKFAGINGLPYGALQSYGSKHQWNAEGDARRWALDFRHLNGAFGISQENFSTTLAATTTTKVDGTNNVYSISIVGDVNVKTIPLLGYAGRFLLQEKSQATLGDTLTDDDSYRFCYAYRDGECRHDSKAGQAYVSVPGTTVTGGCQASQLSRNTPCLMTAHPLGAWAIQVDTTQPDLAGASLRRLTMGFMGPGRQYAFGNLRALPDGTWALMSGWWIDGLRQDALLVKIPALHSSSNTTPRRRATPRVVRDNFVPIDVQIAPRVGAEQAIVDFGYEEYGPEDGFYCTARSEQCHAVSATTDAQTPFLYTSEVTRGSACKSACTIRIQALAARVLYYQVRYLDANGATVETTPLQVIVGSEERFTASSSATVGPQQGNPSSDSRRR
jgi:hypothetical protein